MRLIDADELEKRIKAYDTNDLMDKAMYNFAHTQLMCMPTAVVHCSECKHCIVYDCGYACEKHHWDRISKESNCGGMGDFYCAEGAYKDERRFQKTCTRTV